MYGQNGTADLAAAINFLQGLDSKQLGTIGKQQSATKSYLNFLNNPIIAMLSGTVSDSGGGGSAGYVPSPQVAMPTAYQYLNSQGPMAEIVQQLMSSDPSVHITPDGAQRLLQSSVNDPNSPLSGQDMSFLTGQLSQVMREINDYQATTAKAQYDASSSQNSSDPFVKMGLPAMSARWSADTVPTDAAGLKNQDYLAWQDNRLAQMAKLYGMTKGANGEWGAAPDQMKSVQPHKGQSKLTPDSSQFKVANSRAAAGEKETLKNSLQKAWDKSIKESGVDIQGYATDKQRMAFMDALHKNLMKDPFASKYLGSMDVGKLVKTEDASNMGAYDVINQQAKDNQARFDSYRRERDKMAGQELGHRNAQAYLMNRSGQTPAVAGLNSRMAFLRQLGIGL